MHDTAPAERVSFLLAHEGLPRKDDLTEDEQLAANKRRVDSLPLPRWQLLCDGSVSPGSDTTDPSSGAAAILQFVAPDGTVTTVVTAVRDCGQYACSYTAESHAILLGLRAAQAHMTGDLPLCVITDSMGQLSCLACGPCRQTEYLPMQTWAALLEVARLRRVTFAFVFSHCGFELHDAIDELAAGARGAPGGAPPVWWRDAARPARNAARCEHDVAVRAGVDFRNAHGPAAAVDDLLRMPMSDAAALNRMRAGVDPALGGWRKRFVDSCPLCATRLGRDPGETNAVLHFVACPHLDARAMRAEIFGGESDAAVADLWTSVGARRFLRYRSGFAAAAAALAPPPPRA
jgi:hypothetical protein